MTPRLCLLCGNLRGKDLPVRGDFCPRCKTSSAAELLRRWIDACPVTWAARNARNVDRIVASIRTRTGLSPRRKP